MTKHMKLQLDVWLLFDNEEDEEASHEANIFLTDEFTFSAEWSNTAVGLVTTREFDTYAEAENWLERSGYRDFSSGDWTATWQETP